MLEKIVDSFEKLCIRIIIDVILIPITIYKIFTKSSFCYDYTHQEMDKEEDEQFTHYLSPIKLSVYTSVFVSFILMDLNKNQGIFGKLSQLTITEKILVIFLLNNFTSVVFSLLVNKMLK
ncbi:hypothetical protein [Riemerella columbina]|uniref:hypothetical protein n=1 Tax=Riemerella columbina TaxID=103810 RepID=UPI00266EFA0D|nr:hypothetical protein [Riemerella columbina]WKS95765.1 hypothetical protein NYR17_03230 [Riemerella columbina]